MITIIDYGVGNLASIENMLKRVGVDSIISHKPEDLLAATKFILPGVGAFDTCAEKLKHSGLLSIVEEKVLKNKIPVLGVCVGMQLLTESSEEGKLLGLGWVKGKIVKFKPALLPENHKVPHMGWTEVHLKKASRLFTDMYDEPRFYFVHSYHAEMDRPEDVLVTANYGYDFVAGVESENIVGVQFHPEKSHKFGMKLFENFVRNY